MLTISKRSQRQQQPQGQWSSSNSGEGPGKAPRTAQRAGCLKAKKKTEPQTTWPPTRAKEPWHLMNQQPPSQGKSLLRVSRILVHSCLGLNLFIQDWVLTTDSSVMTVPREGNYMYISASYSHLATLSFISKYYFNHLTLPSYG